MTGEAGTAAAIERALDVPVAGGSLHGSDWRPDAPGPVVVGVHGITANHRSFHGLADRLGMRLVALDLRGRGRSRALPGPYDLDALAADVAAALDALAISRAIVVGHSMGAFVAARLAASRPDLVASLVLVDGGLPLASVADPAAVLGPAIERLSRTFGSREEYRDLWRQHPAFVEWSTLAEKHVDHDLALIDGALRPSALPEAVRVAMLALGDADAALAALDAVRAPIRLLTSPLGLLAEPPGLYGGGRLQGLLERLPAVRASDVPGTNHYTILLGAGIDAVARATEDAAHEAAGGEMP
ncbi:MULTISPECIES: alpha/beta fold hydrolase [unclassified Agrococcus]|uniref:alpha/beta fold hydrolase n=1 Tax=unclassified Agrococcus TaxID=2615065 RepID=UPI00361EB229